jgi:ABC-type oligopeptide transport system ATPase subunit
MYVKHLILKNIRGIDALSVEFSPGHCTVVSGENGSGKSSIADSFIYLEENSHDPDMIRNFRKGATRGEITLEIGDEKGEFDGALIQCVITPEKTTRTLRHPRLGRIGVAESKKWLQSTLTMVSLDPIRILEAKQADQVKIFLESLPVHVTKEQLSFLPEEKTRLIDYGKHALEVIGTEKSGIMGLIYDDRRTKKAMAEEKWATVRAMKSGLPPNPPTGDWSSIHRQRSRDLAQLRDAASDKAAQIIEQSKQAIREQDDRFHKTLLDIKDDLMIKKTALQEAASNKMQDAEVAHSEACQYITIMRDKALEAGRSEYEPKNEELLEKITEAKTMLDQQVRAQEAKIKISQLETDAQTIDVACDAFTSWIDRLKQLKVTLLGDIPIQGLEFVEGEIFMNGLPLHIVNDAEKYRIVFEIAKLRMGPLGFCIMDDFEKFDDQHKDLILKSANAAGIQLLAAIRTEGPLTITQ